MPFYHCEPVITASDARLRFTDFQVNEIAEDGKIIHLTSIGSLHEPHIPQSTSGQASGQASGSQAAASDSKEAPGAPKQPTQPKSQSDALIEVSPEDEASLASLAGAQFVADVMEMLKSATIQSDNSEEQQPGIKRVTAEPTDDRSKRAQIHQEVRRIFQSKIDTSTDETGTIVATVVTRGKGKKRSRRRPGKSEEQEQPAGEYLHFTLYKENRDTMDAVSQIARMLRLKPQAVGYAGTKDRRASTAQRCSLRYAKERALAGTNSKLFGIFTGDYEYKEYPIHLGKLLGNEFVITIKNCRLVDRSAGEQKPTEERVEARVEALRANIEPALAYLEQHGWINYFGHQRFGTFAIGTHDIGKLILGDKFEEAVMSLLSYDPEIAAKAEAGDIPEEVTQRDDCLRHQACMLFMTGKDYGRAEQLIPRRYNAEVCILRHLNRAGAQSRRDYVGAIVHITRGLRSMYLHAYQSYVWNHVASMRWEKHGQKVVKGDLVVVDAEPTPLVGGQDQDGDDIINPTDIDEDQPVQVRALTEEEASSGRYTIYDIVLPSPGYEVIYPDNDIGEFYTEFMAREENGALDPQKMRRMRREFSLPGRYRKLMNKFLAKPSTEVRAYSQDTEQMHPTDLDRVKQVHAADEDEPARKRAKVDESEANADGGDEASKNEPSGEGQEPQKLSVIVKFQLRSSAYATVALRELMGELPDGT